MIKRYKLDNLSLQGLTVAPPQVLGGIRLVPILREHIAEDLRLAKRANAAETNLVRVAPGIEYFGYIPHALVARWGEAASEACSFGTKLGSTKSGSRSSLAKNSKDFVHGMMYHRMRKRTGDHELRCLPLHVAMEGFLALHFGGPSIAWEEYSRIAQRDGLSPRIEFVRAGQQVVGLEDALRLFEIHVRQVGVLLFVGDSLTAAFICPHPDDYKQLHETIITDFFSEQVIYDGLYAANNCYHPEPIRSENVKGLADLRTELTRVRRQWSELQLFEASNLLARPVDVDTVYELGPFRLSRFMTDFDPKNTNHIGEFIHRADGSLEYLKTYRLSAGQCRRAYLIKSLGESQWDLQACAQRLACTKEELIYRMEKAGIGYLLHQHVLDAVHKSLRKGH
ncbi:MAG: hypothetical protein SFV81_26795 [Pirellulaceae bacterium]|nr:hypothetical protein [Pirellulaceae bacterium]